MNYKNVEDKYEKLLIKYEEIEKEYNIAKY